jgi:predicted helicase
MYSILNNSNNWAKEAGESRYVFDLLCSVEIAEAGKMLPEGMR